MPDAAPLFQSRAETRILIDRLRALSPGESVKLASLSKEVGCDLASEHHRHLLSSARHVLEREGTVFQVLRGAVTRLDTTGAIHRVEGWGSAIRRKALRAVRLTARIPLDDVAERERPNLHALQATMGVVAQFTAPATARRLVAQAEKQELPSPERLAFEGLLTMTKGK